MNKINQFALRNLSHSEPMEWTSGWKVGMVTHDFSQKVLKFVTIFRDFFPICQLWKWFHWIFTNKINQSVSKIYLVPTGRIIFLGEITNVFNIFSNYLSSFSCVKLFKFILIFLYMLFYNRNLSPGRYLSHSELANFCSLGDF